MKSGFDINRIKGDGYLILPISMAKIKMGQSPEKIYEIFDFFASKLQNYSNDVILLYTNGLYFNSENIDYNYRIKTNHQILEHSYNLRKLIEKKKKYIPTAFHFLPIDYVILNSHNYRDYFLKLKNNEKIDINFQEAIKKDIGNRPYTEANINFIIEEVVISHIIKQREIEFPRTLVKNDLWRLISYPGKYMEADLYQWKNDLLEKNDGINPFVCSHYNFIEKKVSIFDEI